MTTYTLTLNEQQAQTIATACEVLARLGIGQFRDALEKLPTKEYMPHGWQDDMHAIGLILKKHMIGNVDGWHSSLGIHHNKVREEAKEAWDLYQVIRNRLSWDRAKAEGVTDGTTRNWSGGMMGVNYDEPFKTSLQPLARMEVTT
jgi:hypothetical protein